MLNFSPQSETEILNLIPDGEYDFVVYESVKHLSKSGNISIKLTLNVFDNNKQIHTIFCYLTSNFMFLLKHFCDSVGLEEAYSKGILSPEMCGGKRGRCKVIIEDAQEGTSYPPKNVIKDFLKPNSLQFTSGTGEIVPDFEREEIPF